MFTKYVTETSFSLSYALHLASGALYHIYQIRRWASVVMSYWPFRFICREKGVKRGSLRNERTRFASISVTTESSRCLRGTEGGGGAVWP